MSTKYTGVDNLEIMDEARKYNDFLKEETFSHSGGAPRALDFGAGIGTFAAALRERGLEVTCVEPDSQLLGRLREMGFDAYPDISDIPSGSFDYIYSLNVLEHIEDDLSAMRQLYRCLSPGGRLFLYLPAFQSIYSSMDKKVGHFRRYRISGLIPRLTEAGFIKEEAFYVDSLGYFVSLLYKLVGNKRGDLNLDIIRLYDTVFFPVSRLMDRVLGHVVGKNIVAVVRRPGP